MLSEWNFKCRPPWSEADLRAKLDVPGATAASRLGAFSSRLRRGSNRIQERRLKPRRLSLLVSTSDRLERDALTPLQSVPTFTSINARSSPSRGSPRRHRPRTASRSRPRSSPTIRSRRTAVSSLRGVLVPGFRKSHLLFNLHRAIAGQRSPVAVVEGFFDAIADHQAGYPTVVALMESALSHHRADLLCTHSARTLITCAHARR